MSDAGTGTVAALRPRLVRWLSAGTAGAGAAAVYWAVHTSTGESRHLGLTLCFAVMLAGLQLAPTWLVQEGAAEGLRVEDALFVPMAMLLLPTEALLALAAAVIFRHVMQRREPWRAAFDTGRITASAAVGLAVVHLVERAATPAGAGPGSVSPALGWRAAAAVAGGLVFTALSTAAVAAMVALDRGGRFGSVVLEAPRLRLQNGANALALGILVGLVGVSHPLALPVVIVPLAVLQATSADALAQWNERKRTEALYEAAAIIRDTMDPEQVTGRLLDEARELLRAVEVELLPGPTPPQVGLDPASLVVQVDDETTMVARGRIGGGRWSGQDERVARALASVAAGALHNARLFGETLAITTNLGEGVVALDGAGRVTYVNPAAARLLARDPDEPVGRTLHDVVHERVRRGPDHGPAQCPLLVPRGNAPVRGDDVFVDGRGQQIPVSYTVAPVRRGSEVIGTVVAFRDERLRKQLEEKLRHQAFHDPLTGLPNRSLFLDRLEHALSGSTRTQRLHALMFIDLDRFKTVNDSLGHSVGDEVLREVARRLSASIRAGETVARFGGDEFTVLLEDISSVIEAQVVAERLLGVVREPFELQDRRIPLSASIGVALSEAGQFDQERLLSCADIAMYAAKANGKDRYEIFDSSGDVEAIARLDMEIALRDAIEGDELTLHYQPIVDLADGHVVGVEALVRWAHPSGRLIPPNEFIPIAEESGLILPLGHWVLEQACRQARLWHAEVPERKPIFVSVNLSARQFQNPELAAEVGAVLRFTGLDPSLLWLEITEGVVMDGGELTTTALGELKSLGLRLAIDDFGTGYSSLGYLKYLPVDAIKIDRCFVDEFGRNPVDTEVVASVIRLARVAGMTVVAEGVSSDEQATVLMRLGCSRGQGYHLSRPLPAEELGRLLRLGNRLYVPQEGADQVGPTTETDATKGGFAA